MNLLDKGKFLLRAQQLEKELNNTEIEARTQDGLIVAVVSAKMQLKKLSIDPAYLQPEKKHLLEQQLVSVIVQAQQKAQVIVFEKTKAIAGDLNMNLPGM